MNKLLLSFALAVSALSADDVYQFAGKHFVASYLQCDSQAIGEVFKLLNAMDAAVEKSGATILDKNFYVFEPNGLTAVYLLSESHASIHTYPEHAACFVDLFTCGDKCSAVEFDETLRSYLCPKDVHVRYFSRTEETKDLAYFDLYQSQ